MSDKTIRLKVEAQCPGQGPERATLVDADTGAPVRGVQRLSLEMSATSRAVLVIEVIDFDLDIWGDAKVVATAPYGQSARGRRSWWGRVIDRIRRVGR